MASFVVLIAITETRIAGNNLKKRLFH